LIVTIIGNVVFWSLTLLLVPLNIISLEGVLLFILAGLLAPGLARLSYFGGMEKLGASLNASIFAMYPIISSIASIFLLNERPTLAIWAGIVCVVCGGAIIEKTTHHNKMKSRKTTKTGLIFSSFAAITAGFGYVVRKMGLNIYDEPIIGAALGYLTALLLYTFLLTLSPNMRSSVSANKQAFRRFWKTGVCLCIGWFLAFHALTYGDVTIVTPLIDTEPFFVFLFAYFYLRKLEIISSKLIIGTLVILIGITFITMF